MFINTLQRKTLENNKLLIVTANRKKAKLSSIPGWCAFYFGGKLEGNFPSVRRDFTMEGEDEGGGGFATTM